MKCAICQIRKPSRYCPAIQGNICGPCCGREREVTLRCPFSCVYLQQARVNARHTVDLKLQPHPEVPLTRDLLDRRLREIALAGRALLSAAREEQGVVDSDVLDVLNSLAITYKTRQSGLIYQSLPEHNVVARRMCLSFEDQMARVLEEYREDDPTFNLTDTGVFEAIVYLHKTAFLENNGRAWCRAFLQVLHERFQMPEEAVESPMTASGLILPG